MAWRATRHPEPDKATWTVEAPGSTFTVTAPPGEDLLRRLDVAVRKHRRGAAPTPPHPPLWRINQDEHHGGGLYELEITVKWDVVEVTTGAVRWRFRSECSASYNGAGWSGGGSSGVDDVALTEDGRGLLVRDSDVVTCRELPLADGG